jgi:hypothetical protein
MAIRRMRMRTLVQAALQLRRPLSTSHRLLPQHISSLPLTLRPRVLVQAALYRRPMAGVDAWAEYPTTMSHDRSVRPCNSVPLCCLLFSSHLPLHSSFVKVVHHGYHARLSCCGRRLHVHPPHSTPSSSCHSPCTASDDCLSRRLSLTSALPTAEM